MATENGREVSISPVTVSELEKANVHTDELVFIEGKPHLLMEVGNQMNPKPDRSYYSKMQGGAELLLREPVPAEVLRRATSVLYETPISSRRKHSHRIMNSIGASTAPAETQQIVLGNELSGDAAMALIYLASIWNRNKTETNDDLAEIETSLTELANVIYPVGSDRAYARKRAKKILSQLAQTHLEVFTKNYDEVGNVVNYVKYWKGENPHRGSRIVIRMQKSLLNETQRQKQYYKISMPFMRMIAGMKVCEINLESRVITHLELPDREPPTPQQISLIRKFYQLSKVKVADLATWKTTMNELCAQSGEMSPGKPATRRLQENIKYALRRLRELGLIQYVSKGGKTYTIVKPERLKIAERSDVTQKLRKSISAGLVGIMTYEDGKNYLGE